MFDNSASTSAYVIDVTDLELTPPLIQKVHDWLAAKRLTLRVLYTSQRYLIPQRLFVVFNIYSYYVVPQYFPS